MKKQYRTFNKSMDSFLLATKSEEEWPLTIGCGLRVKEYYNGLISIHSTTEKNSSTRVSIDRELKRVKTWLENYKTEFNY